MEPEDQQKKTFLQSVLSWGESPFAGLGVGVIIGGVGADISLKILYLVGGIFIGIAFVRARFFDHFTAKGLRFFFNSLGCVVLAVVLFLAWKITPKSKEPPTAEENAAAIVALENNQKAKEPPVATAQEKQPQPANLPKSLGLPKGHMTPKKPSEQPSTPVVPAPIATPPPQVAQFSVTQNQEVSSRTDAPYKIRVVVQANMDLSTLRMAVQCDGPIVAVHGGNTGIFLGGKGIVNGHPNVYVINYQSITPPFGPANPIILYMWSANPIRCNEVSTF
jgi:hypothetical protein